MSDPFSYSTSPFNGQAANNATYTPTYASDTVGTAGAEMGNTIRSLRDTLSSSFQTLNLTLSSMTTTLRGISQGLNMQSGTAFASGRTANYIPSMQLMNNTGSLSSPMAGVLANSSAFNLMAMNKPFNVSAMEWNFNRDLEVRNRLTGGMVDAGMNAFNLGGGILAGNAMGSGLVKLGSHFIPGLAGNSLMAGAGRFALGGMGLGGMLGFGAVASYADAVKDSADTYGRDIAGIRRMSVRTGHEFSYNQSAQVARSLQSASLNEIQSTDPNEARLGSQGYRQVLFQGLQSNLFQGTSPEQLTKQLEQGARVVRFLTGVLGSKDVNETMDFVTQIKMSGVNMFKNPGMATSLGNASFKYGAMMGVSGADLLRESVAHGNQVYNTLGLPGAIGIKPMMSVL